MKTFIGGRFTWFFFIYSVGWFLVPCWRFMMKHKHDRIYHEIQMREDEENQLFLFLNICILVSIAGKIGLIFQFHFDI